jgi:hypothetical protein
MLSFLVRFRLIIVPESESKIKMRHEYAPLTATSQPLSYTANEDITPAQSRSRISQVRCVAARDDGVLDGREAHLEELVAYPTWNATPAFASRHLLPPARLPQLAIRLSPGRSTPTQRTPEHLRMGPLRNYLSIRAASPAGSALDNLTDVFSRAYVAATFSAATTYTSTRHTACLPVRRLVFSVGQVKPTRRAEDGRTVHPAPTTQLTPSCAQSVRDPQRKHIGEDPFGRAR